MEQVANGDVVPGLRERKKKRTREQIVAAARRLFVERGYDATSVADIAEAAEIGQSTFFVYFPTKADVLFAGTVWPEEFAAAGPMRS